MLFAFSRDDGVPGFSKALATVSPKYRTPVNAIWTATVLCILYVMLAMIDQGRRNLDLCDRGELDPGVPVPVLHHSADRRRGRLWRAEVADPRPDMPKRTDINSIMIIGAGPIVIGQACEFDYSGAQACKALREEGYRVILVNSNPATIMTDPGLADATYIEPITPEVVAKIIEKGTPRRAVADHGRADRAEHRAGAGRHGRAGQVRVELIGAKREAIEMAEDRKLFREAMDRIGLENPKATIVAAPKLPNGKYDIAAGVRQAMRRWNMSACPPSSAPPSPLAAPAAASPITATITRRS
jgi:hypothetical protein